VPVTAKSDFGGISLSDTWSNGKSAKHNRDTLRGGWGREGWRGRLFALGAVCCLSGEQVEQAVAVSVVAAGKEIRNGKAPCLLIPERCHLPDPDAGAASGQMQAQRYRAATTPRKPAERANAAPRLSTGAAPRRR